LTEPVDLEMWWKAYGVAFASLLSGAALVHNFYKPDLNIYKPDLVHARQNACTNMNFACRRDGW